MVARAIYAEISDRDMRASLRRVFAPGKEKHYRQNPVLPRLLYKPCMMEREINVPHGSVVKLNGVFTVRDISMIAFPHLLLYGISIICATDTPEIRESERKYYYSNIISLSRFNDRYTDRSPHVLSMSRRNAIY